MYNTCTQHTGSINQSFQVCLPSLLLCQAAQAEAGEPQPQCGGTGQTAVFCLEAHDTRAEKTLRYPRRERQAEVTESALLV